MSLISLALVMGSEAYTDDSEVVVLEGSVGSGTSTIEFGEGLLAVM